MYRDGVRHNVGPWFEQDNEEMQSKKDLASSGSGPDHREYAGRYWWDKQIVFCRSKSIVEPASFMKVYDKQMETLDDLRTDDETAPQFLPPLAHISNHA